MKIKFSPASPLVATICNITLAFVIYMLCRVAYVWENWSLFATGWDSLRFGDLLRGSLRFDASAIAYTNGVYVVLMLLPLLPKERPWWHTMTKWIYTVVNSLAVVINLSDAVYSQFTGRRTTSTFFHEFSNEGNLGSIFFTELINHWYLLLAGIALIAMLWLLYVKPDTRNTTTTKAHFKLRYYIIQSVALVLAFPLAVVAMRGGMTRAIRPIAVSNANQYVNQPHEAAIVLNTTFSIIRTAGKTTFVDPQYFDSHKLENIYTPLHIPQLSAGDSLQRKNVVVLIVESFGREYIGFYNKHLDNGTYKGYTPFIDSLLEHSLTWEQTYANGRKSIDAMPSVLSSIPMFIEPYFVTNYSLNRTGGIAAELGRMGWSSAFFHGAENSSMGFQAFARATKFENYYGRTEFNDDSRFDGDKAFDGTWAIWDEPFLQYYATKMSEMKEPFVTAVFTASSHHPFAIPKQYHDIYPEEEMPIHKCIRYTDNALRRFFETASRQPWFKNTIFVLTNDHTNMSNHDEYQTSLGLFQGTIIFYDPSGQLPTGVMPGIAQQIDIMPTLLGILNYPNPYVAFGKDLLKTAPDSSWTVNYSNGIYQYLQCDTLIQFDGTKVTGVYDLHGTNILDRRLNTPPSGHVIKLKAIIQQYMSRMVNDKLTAE
ncbi:MAG: LTA synthase family protein [Bacteroidales bacterium]|nr:LTA synthase family protein [Bacteroidales bacterium]